jgi:hypothetical protein
MDKQVVDLVRQLREQVVKNYYAMRLNASGRFDKETVVTDYGSGVKIEAPAYVFQMEEGRDSGSMPPIKAIKQWIKDKNANAGTDIPEEAAYAIAYVIKRDGIKVPNRFNKGGVVSTLLNDAAVKKLAAEVNKIIKAEILRILTK